MVLPILNFGFLPRIVIFMGSSTAYSANLTCGNLQVHSQWKRDIRICFEGYVRYERINGRLFLKKLKI
jgi:hypothetical protein